MPTVLEAVGGKRENRAVPTPPGRSLLPLLARDGPLSRDFLWWLHEGNRALRVGDWKIVAAGKDGPWELYDMANDRSEDRNRAAAMPERVSAMAALWTKQFDEYAALARRDAKPEPKD